MNELELHTTRMNLKNLMLNEESKLQRILAVISFTKFSKTSKVNNALSKESNIWESK